MSNFLTTLNQTVYKNADGSLNITMMSVLGVVLGAAGVYFLIPKRKRLNLFK